MQVGDDVRVKETGNIETVENISCTVGYGRHGLFGVTHVYVETENGIYEQDELELVGE